MQRLALVATALAIMIAVAVTVVSGYVYVAMRRETEFAESGEIHTFGWPVAWRTDARDGLFQCDCDWGLEDGESELIFLFDVAATAMIVLLPSLAILAILGRLGRQFRRPL